MKFEKALASLADLVEQLEAGELSLDESLKVFEKGVKLTRECQQQLQAAEQKVTHLMAEQPLPDDSGAHESDIDGFDMDDQP